MASVAEERDELQRMLRKVCRAATSLPVDVQAWWTDEQARIAEQEALADVRKAERIASIQQRIAELQAQLAALS
jgi:hypothetical protein